MDLRDSMLPRSVTRRLEADRSPGVFLDLAIDRARLVLTPHECSGKLAGPQLRDACASLCRQIPGWVDASAGGSCKRTDSEPKRNGSDSQLAWVFDQTRLDMKAARESTRAIELRLQELRSSPSPEMLHSHLEKLNARHGR